jgi:excisionase family DNA binding protein
MNSSTILDTQLLRAEEVAKILKIGRSTVYQMCKRRELPFVAINHSIRIPADALQSWMSTRLNLPAEGP